MWYAAGTFSLKYDGHHCLSPAPQALPHALAAFNCLKKRFFNIIIAFEGCMTNLLILLSTTKLDHLFLTDKKLYLCQIVTIFSLLLIDKRLPTQKTAPICILQIFDPPLQRNYGKKRFVILIGGQIKYAGQDDWVKPITLSGHLIWRPAAVKTPTGIDLRDLYAAPPAVNQNKDCDGPHEQKSLARKCARRCVVTPLGFKPKTFRTGI